MLRSKRFFGLLVLATSSGFALQAAACGDDDARNTGDSGTPDTSTASDSAVPDTQAPDAADAAKPAPVFLDPSEYSDLITIDAAFPYGVTQRHAADTMIVGSTKWGTNGPIVTIMPDVISWTLPADPKGAATPSTKTAAAATGLPDAMFFYGADGFVEVPFDFALQSYTTSAAHFPGEALLYAPAFGSVVSRAEVNGFYSGVGITDGTTNEIVYSGLSPLYTGAVQSTDDTGLYAAPLCAGTLVPTGTCAVSHKLFGWTGASGPVVSDTNGNVFVAASLGDKGEVYGISRTQALATGAASHATLATDPTLAGVGSFAAVAEKGSPGGWLVAIGFNGYPDFTTNTVQPVYAVEYTSGANGVASGTHPYTAAITPSKDVSGIALFSDNDGNLWAAITVAPEGGTAGGAFIELQKKP